MRPQDESVRLGMAWDRRAMRFSILTVIALVSLIPMRSQASPPVSDSTCERPGAVVIGPRDACRFRMQAGGYRYEVGWDDVATGVAVGEVFRGSTRIVRTEMSLRAGSYRGGRHIGDGYQTWDGEFPRVHFLLDEPGEMVFYVLPYSCVEVTCSTAVPGAPIGSFSLELVEDDFS